MSNADPVTWSDTLRARALVENGKVTLARAWGYANLETGTPLDTSAVFEPASVTKQFTAAALLLLVEEGKVGLNDPVGKCVEKAPASWVRILVRMLLSHTSGLPIDGLPGFEGSTLLLITSKQAVEFIVRGSEFWVLCWVLSAGCSTGCSTGCGVVMEAVA